MCHPQLKLASPIARSSELGDTPKVLRVSAARAAEVSAARWAFRARLAHRLNGGGLDAPRRDPPAMRYSRTLR